MANRFFQTNGAFGPMVRQNQKPVRFTRPLNPGAWMRVRPFVGAQPTSSTLAGVEGKSCCSDCAKDGRRHG